MGGTLDSCALIGNSTGAWGGGAFYGTLNKCLLTGNSADLQGGGAYLSTLNNCTLTGNSAFDGGGASFGTLNNCTLTGNSAIEGGGAYGGTLNNCTVTGNSASHSGGGVYGDVRGYCQPPCLANNCIVYFNSAGASGANYDMAFPEALRMNYCDTTPLPESGAGNISLDPQLASASHLSASSPCRGAGSGAYATGSDIDVEAWRVPPSIGCDEYQAGAVTGPLSVSIVAAFTNAGADYPVGLTALIEGRTTTSGWEFGDGVTASNRPYASHAWTAPGDYAVVLRAYNETLPAGVSATATVHVVVQPVHYAAANSANPAPPYTSWATAARNIQDAVDAATVPGALVLVTNGIYATGGRPVFSTMTNRVAVDKPLTLRSVNGPQNTVIQGYQVPGTTNGDGAIRCVYLANGASLSGFTLTQGATLRWTSDDRDGSGGGVWCESENTVVTNCVVTGNSAYYAGGGTFRGTLKNCSVTGNRAEGGGGGGAYQGVLQNCTLTANRAQGEGGGATYCTLNNCTLTGNSAFDGGGASFGTLNNCTLINNSAFDDGGGASGGTLNNCTLTGDSA